MRILLVHNHYGSGAPSGENLVFELERDMLRRNGHEVETFERFSDALRARGTAGTAVGGMMTPWNPFAARAMAEAKRRFCPDIVHAHNTFPILSSSIFRAAQGAGRVLTLHNYRLVCPAAIPMREGEVCTECIDARSVLPALRHGCYRKSRLATLPIAMNVAINRWRGTWHSDVECLIALTEFQRNLMVHAGLPGDSIAVKPNFYPRCPKIKLLSDRPRRAIFVGRLSEEKGVGDLIDAWLIWGADAPTLRIIGEGPLRSELEKRASGSQNIKFLGQLKHEKVEQEIANARMLILPSRWFEGFPMVMPEAFAFGTPVAVSDKGALPDLAIQADGVVFRSGTPEDLFSSVFAAWNEPGRLDRMSAASSEVFAVKYSESQNYRQLLEIYEFALRAREQNTDIAARSSF
jgi:glycosyltransferase involved in cell wall biosynthesis